MGNIKTDNSNPWLNKAKVDQIKGITPTVSPPQTKPQTTTPSVGSGGGVKLAPPKESVISEKELSQLESGLEEISSTSLVKKSQSLPSTSKLEEVSPKPEPPKFSRCKVDFPDDLEVYPQPTGPDVPRISNKDLKNLVKKGEINVVELMKLVPKDSENLFFPSRYISEGSKFQFIAKDFRGREREVEIKFHSPDDGAYNQFGKCNSSQFWTAQIRIDGRLLNTSGNLQYRSSNQTHIPLLFAPKSEED